MPTIQTPQATVIVKQPSIGPFKAMGMLFGMFGTAIGTANKALLTVDTIVDTAQDTVTHGRTAVNIVINGALNDFASDELVADAERTIKQAEAKAKADAILATLKPKA